MTIPPPNAPVPPAPPVDTGGLTGESGPDLTSQNLEAVLEFHRREEQKISRAQRIVEKIACFIGEPLFFGMLLLFATLWMLGNAALPRWGLPAFDPPPYGWLQGIFGFCGLLTAIVVVSRQDRLAKLAELRAHLDLKISLLTEQKTAKLIDLLEELRRDLPNVKNRHDSDAAALRQSMSPDLVIAALDERREADETPKPAAGL